MRSLCIKLPQMVGCATYIDRNKTMSFKVSNKKTVKKMYQNMGKNQQFNEYGT